ncbi:MAG: tRNA-queuosine alpha-mannosyltransferase domain-containing protein [Coriobacteriia bacterium]
MRILGIEPYYGGSHRAVLDGLVERIDTDWTLLTLPARKWKWRMRGSAITFAAELRDRHAAQQAAGERGPCFDLVFASTFVNLAELYGLAGEALAGVPSVLYFHENQFAYPNRHVADWDYQFPLTNITSALAARACVFNSDYTRRTFIGVIDAFMREFPDHRPRDLAREIGAKSSVIAPPYDPAPFDAVPVVRGYRPRIVWPHRWEHDKDPETFLAAVAHLAKEGLDFEVAVAGQSFRDTAHGMHEAASALGDRLVHVGEPESREEYAALLASSDIAVSTATNEFFGLAMIESCYAGAMPVVPDRLAYVDLYPAAFRYDGVDELVARLRSLVREPPTPGAASELASRYTFDALVGEYQVLFERVAGARE